MMYIVLAAALFFQTSSEPSLDSSSPKERMDAIEKMAVLGNREAIPALAAALKKEPKSDFRAQIVAGLGRIRDRAALPVLGDALRNDLDKDVRSQAIDSLLRLYIPIEETGQIRTVFNKVKSVFMQPNGPVVGPEVTVDSEAKELLAAAMQKDFNDDVRGQAVRALGSLRATDQIPLLISALEDPKNREHRTVRVEIAHTLGMLRDPSAGPALEKALRDSDKDVVAEAVLGVGLVGYTSARPVIEETFRTSSSAYIKGRALESLALFHDRASIPLFESLLSNKDDNYRELSAEGLARVKYEGAKDWQIKYEQERSPNVRIALAYGLAASGDIDYINHMANSLDSRQVDQAEVYLFELGKYNGQLNELYRYLRSSNPKVRQGMLRVIGRIGDPTATDKVRPLTEDANTEVVREAVDTLRKLSR